MAKRQRKAQDQEQETAAPVLATPSRIVETETNAKEAKMSEEISSIIEYSEDITNAEQPDPLPAGEYPMTIKGVERQTSKKGFEYAAVAFYISPDDFPADYPLENAPDGVTITYRRVILDDTPRARFNMRRFCEAIGASTSKRIDLNDWIGLQARGKISADEYEGVRREQIDSVTAL